MVTFAKPSHFQIPLHFRSAKPKLSKERLTPHLRTAFLSLFDSISTREYDSSCKLTSPKIPKISQSILDTWCKPTVPIIRSDVLVKSAYGQLFNPLRRSFYPPIRWAITKCGTWRRARLLALQPNVRRAQLMGHWWDSMRPIFIAIRLSNSLLISPSRWSTIPPNNSP